MTTLKDRQNFVRNVKLSIPPPPSTAAAEDDTAAVVGSSVILFVGNLSEQQRSDVINSSLFAQLAASAQYDRFKEDQVAKWYGVYRNTLENIGWIVESFSFIDIDNANRYGSVDKAIISIMEAFLTPTLVETFKAMIYAFKRPDMEEAYTLFKSKSWKDTTADFQTGVCVGDSGSNVKWRFGAYRYQASGFDGDVLFFRFGADPVPFRCNTQDMVLNEAIYATLRDAIIDKLGDRAEDNVRIIPLNQLTRK
ncbi:uncharacterized protein LAESUDRAFT_424143 [Laetiporus sulphureus 93-53]|uniref:Uncharacterized protein n=1 Tax=Laetiporus sulphureus 93-53 TaxID=1314785 RepID=A0A165GIP9_9APHY|nr:uncharacterized protein LAESUDRAFT_424143 [Laetiporus sulphureus 93-53]KZT10402.1 hypothetical protein LAESUDRAFT_424143 [Laetiporus sulphureus 93-53]